jgi:hypothetical protein
MPSQSRCPDEGTLYAYLDQELASEAGQALAAHVRSCPSCREALVSLEQSRRATRAPLASLEAPPAAFAAPSLALQRFRQRLAQPEAPLARWRFDSMFYALRRRRWGPAVAAALLVAILASGLAISPVRAAASRFLGIFRVQKFTVIQVNSQQLEALNGYQSLVLGEPRFDNIGHSPVADVAAASQAAGFPVLAPTWLPQQARGATQIEVTSGGRAATQVNIAAARSILRSANLSTSGLPAGMDQAEVWADIPPVVVQHYGTGQNGLMVIQSTSPTVHVPDGFDMAAVGEQGLRLLGMDATTAQQMARRIDWGTTLIVPVPVDLASFQQVQVRGVDAYLFTSSGRSQSSGVTSGMSLPQGMFLLWNADGRIYAIGGTVSRSELIQAAESLK